MADQSGLVSWHWFDSMAAKKCVVFQTLLPEVLTAVAAVKEELHRVLVITLTEKSQTTK